MANATIPGGGGGKIKSVGLTMPGEFSVANSPLTSSGTLAVTKVNQNANLVYAGPTSGIAAQPTFRSIVAADLPAGIGTVTSVALSLPSFITVSGSPVTTSGTLTGTLATQTANTVFAGPTSGGALAPTFRALVTADLPAGTGTVTSVGLSTNAAWLTVGSSPITGAGTITLNSTTGLTANQVLATPNGGTGAVSLRALVAADIPVLPASQITTGQLALARGGTNADLSATGAANSFLKQSSSGAAITVGTIASADLTTALTTPPAIGGTTPAAGAFTTLGGTIITASTRFVGPIIAPASDSTTAVKVTKADGTTAVLTVDTTNGRVGFGATPGFSRVDVFAANTTNAFGIWNSSQTNKGFIFYTNTVGVTDTDLRIYYNGLFAGDRFSIQGPSGYVGVGIGTATARLYVLDTDTATATVTNALVLDHSTSGTAAAGYGTGALIRGQSSTTANQSMTDIQASWVVPTHASRTSRVIHNVYDTAAREVLRFEASGTAPMIGFLGAAAVVRQTDGNNLTNNVTSGGTTAQIDDFTSLTLYATDAAAIRNDIYQLARMLKICNDALRLYGLLT